MHGAAGRGCEGGERCPDNPCYKFNDVLLQLHVSFLPGFLFILRICRRRSFFSLLFLLFACYCCLQLLFFQFFTVIIIIVVVVVVVGLLVPPQHSHPPLLVLNPVLHFVLMLNFSFPVMCFHLLLLVVKWSFFLFSTMYCLLFKGIFQ